jgi:hypothetical protein
MTETTTTIRVECYAGHRGEESPRRFFLGERAIEVVDIVDRWLDPAHRYFKVRGDDGGVYILRHDVPVTVGQQREAIQIAKLFGSKSRICLLPLP